ncbi:MAG: HlyC/CorC family transporter [Gammaproteobacteria bacterium]|nr:HlyC/CorC family transporter [Gammaproteobacteria bacterium]MBI5617666.1 HlyC/CorC family transporter [Gammaproteobacteria bacterium]
MIPDDPVLLLVGTLVGMIVGAAYFAGTETALMALNRYRLRHLADRGHPGAKRASKLLERPDRLIGFILLGNTFVNIVATQIATIVTLEAYGEHGLIVVTAVLTVLLLVFGEILPKTFAALNPERVAFPSSWLLLPLMWLCHPITATLNAATNAILKLFRTEPRGSGAEALNREELRTVVKEAGAMIPEKHRDMLFGILDLEKANVQDIMIPRGEIVAIDLDEDWVDVVDQIVACRHTRVPCYRGSMDNVIGILHMRNLARLMRDDDGFGREDLVSILAEPYYVPLKTDLNTQLINFQVQRQRMGLVVDEYGDIEGLVTIDDLLEEVVGEFTTVPQFNTRGIVPQADGSFLVDGSAYVRELNRGYGWSFPDEGPKTLNGLIMDALEDIPETGTSLRIGGYTIEIVHSTGHSVRTARVFPPHVEPGAPGGEEAHDETRD